MSVVYLKCGLSQVWFICSAVYQNKTGDGEGKMLVVPGKGDRLHGSFEMPLQLWC